MYEELFELGLSDVLLDDYGYVMVKFLLNVNYLVFVIGFIVYMDIFLDVCGKYVKL